MTSCMLDWEKEVCMPLELGSLRNEYSVMEELLGEELILVLYHLQSQESSKHVWILFFLPFSQSCM